MRKRKIKRPKNEQLQEKRLKLQENHRVLQGCIVAKCKLKCSDRFDDEQRNKINSEYWKLNWEQQKSFILHQCSRNNVKRRTLKTESSQRNVTIQYHLHSNEGTKLQVCKLFFLTTLGYKPKNDGIVFRALSTVARSSSTPAPDRRGHHPNKDKIDREQIHLHIESFHPESSHYRREHAPNVRYLPDDVTINFMFRDFCRKYQNTKISYELYRKVVGEMNIHFTKLGHEQCEQCETFRLHNAEHTRDNLDTTCEICSKWSAHNSKVVESRKRYKKHADMIFDENTLCISADLQKIIMLPRMDMFKAVIFVRRLTAYNESFVPVGRVQKSRRPFAVLWHEAITSRKKEDIISTYYQFFLHNRDTKNIIIWLDNCSAQNKNWCMLSFFVHIVNSSMVSLETLEVNFFEPGHTFMSADSFHHQVELSLKKKNKTYDFLDFVDSVSKSNSGKVDVKSMQINDFFQWKDHHSVAKTNNIKLNNPKPYLSDIVQIRAERGKFTLKYKTRFQSETEHELNFIKNASMKTIVTEPIALNMEDGIEEAKKEALLKVVGPLMDKTRLQFWKNLPVKKEN